MKFQEIYSDITNSFGALWQYKERGNTLEIITPFATTNNRFISVFIKQQGNEFIIFSPRILLTELEYSSFKLCFKNTTFVQGFGDTSK